MRIVVSTLLNALTSLCLLESLCVRHAVVGEENELHLPVSHVNAELSQDPNRHGPLERGSRHFQLVIFNRSSCPSCLTRSQESDPSVDIESEVTPSWIRMVVVVNPRVDP